MRPTHLETRYKHDLSPRQREVLELIARGKTNAEIADELGISLDGAKYHVREILAKLGVESREEAAQEWRRMRSPLGWLRHLVLAGLGGLPKSGPLLALVGAGAVVASGGAAIAVIALTGGEDRTTLASADVAATATPTAEPTATPTPGGDDDALRRDAEEYAKALGISLDEAIERLRMQTNSGPIIQALRAIAPGRLAGTWVEHVPDFRVVAWYTGDAIGLDPAWIIAAQSDIPVEIRLGAKYTEDELLSLAQRVMWSIGPRGGAGGYGDVMTGTVVLWIPAGWPEAGDPDALAARLEAEFDVPVVVKIGQITSENVPGSNTGDGPD